MLVETKTMLAGVKPIIGNTPLLAIHFKFKGFKRTIYGKLESHNVTGSIKDRMASHIIERSYIDGTLKKGDQIIEATSGNTGIAFAALGAHLGHKVKIIMPDWMSQERIAIIKSYGAEIELISKEEGGFLRSIELTKEYARELENTFLPCQFENEYNVDAHYSSTGPEIWNQFIDAGINLNAFVAGVGTGGTVMGTGKYLKEKDATIKIHPLEPENSPTLSTGYKVGKHRIQGISDDFIPEIVKLDQLDEIISVDDGDAIIMAQKINQKLGVGAGISSGANFLGALKAQEKLGGNAGVATILCDCNKKYLSTDLTRIEPVKAGFLSSEVELLGCEIVT